MRTKQFTDHYPWHIYWVRDLQCFEASCPTFNSLIGLGSTPEYALAEGKKALKQIIEHFRKNSLELPVPEVITYHKG